MDSINQLHYTIKGTKLDTNILPKEGQKIIWRTDKSVVEIEEILKEIQERIRIIAKQFDIAESEIKLFSTPLLAHTEEAHACFFPTNKTQYTPRAQQENRALRELMTRKGNFLTKDFLCRANKKLRKAQNTHLLFCKNKPKDSIKNPAFSINDNAIHRQSDRARANMQTKINVSANLFLCENKDWIEEYKQSVQPVLCGHFYIRPSWHKENPQYENLIIDPSLSFGSGHHATTALCIEALCAMDLRGKSLLDVGCGSGILSLVGAKLGAHIYACDTDKEATIQSMQNFALNNATYSHIWHGSMQSIENLNVLKEYDYICANIVTSVLLLLKKDLIARLKHDGILIVSGILEEHEDKILKNFAALVLLEKKQIGEWLCFKFIKK